MKHNETNGLGAGKGIEIDDKEDSEIYNASYMQKISPKTWMGLWFSLLIIFLIGMYGGLFVNLYSHEAVHKEIYANYNLKSDIEIDYLTLTGYTQAYAPQEGDFSDYCDENCEMAHSLTESIGYQLQAAIVNLWIIFFLFIVFTLFFKDMLRRDWK